MTPEKKHLYGRNWKSITTVETGSIFNRKLSEEMSQIANVENIYSVLLVMNLRDEDRGKRPDQDVPRIHDYS